MVCDAVCINWPAVAGGKELSGMGSLRDACEAWLVCGLGGVARDYSDCVLSLANSLWGFSTVDGARVFWDARSGEWAIIYHDVAYVGKEIGTVIWRKAWGDLWLLNVPDNVLWDVGLEMREITGPYTRRYSARLDAYDVVAALLAGQYEEALQCLITRR